MTIASSELIASITEALDSRDQLISRLTAEAQRHTQCIADLRELNKELTADFVKETNKLKAEIHRLHTENRSLKLEARDQRFVLSASEAANQNASGDGVQQPADASAARTARHAVASSSSSPSSSPRCLCASVVKTP
jgi:regulator of replication initiation timing